MLNNKEEKVNKIRHVRCIVPSVKNPLEIKKQTYKSKKEYKNKYYAAAPPESYAMSVYESLDKKQKNYAVYNLFDISENRKILNIDIPTTDENGFKLKHTLFVNDIVLLYQNNVEELYQMVEENEKHLLKERLYIIRGFWKKQTAPPLVILQKTINAEKTPNVTKLEDFNKTPEKMRKSVNQLKYLIKGKDFDLVNGEIVFFNKNK